MIERTKRWLHDYAVSLSWTLVFLVLIANSLLSYLNFQHMARLNDEVKVQDDKTELTNRVLQLLIDAETGQRGFIITGEQSYLEPYDHALRLLNRELKQLRFSFESDLEQMENVKKVASTAAFKLKEMQAVIDLRKAQGFEEAQRRIMQDQGKKYMDEIRHLIQHMNDRESGQLKTLSQKVLDSRFRALVMLIGGTLVLIGMSVATFVLMRQQLRYRASMDQALRQTNNELESRVKHRTEALVLTNVSLQDEIEERKRLETQAVQFAAELQRSNKELEQFASVASHDLQEPLRKIQAFSDRLVTKYRGQLDDTGKEYIERIQFSAGRMRQLIEDLLTFSRVGTRGMAFEPVDLNQVVKEVLTDLEVRLQETQATLDVDDLPTIAADALQMRQLFQNLLGNALKFHRPDVAPHLAIKLKSSGTSLVDESAFCELTVSDNGIGFEKQYAERIFQLFQRLHGRTEYEGTGMGLAICKKIVERHGGSIIAESIPGTGSTFTMRLPFSHITP